MKIKLLLSFLIATVSVQAQITFHKTFGGNGDDYGTSVQQTNDGGYIITGFTNGVDSGNADVYLVKTDAYGDTIWTRTFGGANRDYGNSVQQTADGGYIIVGLTYSFGGAGSKGYLIKTNSNGDFLWNKTFDAFSSDAVGLTVQQTMEGGYIVAGSIEIFPFNENAYLIKTDANGDSLWTRIYGGADEIKDVSCYQTMDSGYILSGTRTDSGSTNSDAWLLKTDALGNIVWSKTYGDAYPDHCLRVQQTLDGGYIMTGWTYSFGAGGCDVFLTKTDANGDLLWTKTFGGNENDAGMCVRQTTGGGYIISGFFGLFIGYRSYLIKTDANGDSLWTRIMGTDDDYANSVQETVDGGYIVTGSTANFGGNSNIIFVKTDANGNKGCYDEVSTSVVSSPVMTVDSPAIPLTLLNTTITSPNTIVDSGGIDSTICISVGIKETVSEKLFLLYPNPASSQCMIHNTSFTIKKAEVFNLLGNKSYPEITVNSEAWIVDCTTLSPGIYFVKVETEKGSSVQKLLVE